MGSVGTGARVDNAKTMDDDEPGGVEGEIDIVTREKQIDTDNKIYYAMHPSEIRIPTTPDKTNETPILINS